MSPGRRTLEAFLVTPLDEHERRANEAAFERMRARVCAEFNVQFEHQPTPIRRDGECVPTSCASGLSRLGDLLARIVARLATTVYVRALPAAIFISVPIAVATTIYSLPIVGWLVALGAAVGMANSEGVRVPRFSLERLSWAYPAVLVISVVVAVPALLVATAAGSVYLWPTPPVVLLSAPPILIFLALVVGFRAASLAVRRDQWSARSIAFVDYQGLQPDAAWRSSHFALSDYPSVEKTFASMATLAGADAPVLSPRMAVAVFECFLLGVVHSTNPLLRPVAYLVRSYAPGIASGSEREFRLLQCRLYFRFGRYRKAAAIARTTNNRWAKKGARSDVLVSFEALSMFSMGKSSDAMEIIDRYPASAANPYLILNRSFLLWQIGRDEEAMIEGRRVLKFDGKCPIALMNEKFSELMRISSAGRLGSSPRKEDLENVRKGVKRAALEAERRMDYVPASILFTLGVTWIALGKPERARELFMNGIELENHDLSRIGLAILAMENSSYFLRARYHLYKVFFGNHRNKASREVRIAKRLIEWCSWAEKNQVTFGREIVWWFLAEEADLPCTSPPSVVLSYEPGVGRSTPGMWWVDFLRNYLAISMREICKGEASGWIKEKNGDWS